MNFIFKIGARTSAALVRTQSLINLPEVLFAFFCALIAFLIHVVPPLVRGHIYESRYAVRCRGAWPRVYYTCTLYDVYTYASRVRVDLEPISLKTQARLAIPRCSAHTVTVCL